MHLLGYEVSDGVSVAYVIDVYTLDIYDKLSLCVLQLMGLTGVLNVSLSGPYQRVQTLPKGQSPAMSPPHAGTECTNVLYLNVASPYQFK